MKVRLNMWIIFAIVAVVGGFLLWQNLKPVGQAPQGDFAQCLTEKGAVMYGTSTCPHCTNQKKLFGDSFKHINYIECTENREICQDRGITGVPAWDIDGERYAGEQSLERLSQLTGCEL